MRVRIITRTKTDERDLIVLAAGVVVEAKKPEGVSDKAWRTR